MINVLLNAIKDITFLNKNVKIVFQDAQFVKVNQVINVNNASTHIF